MNTQTMYETKNIAWLSTPSFEEFVQYADGSDTPDEQACVGDYVRLCLAEGHVPGLHSVPLYLYDTIKVGLSLVVLRGVQKRGDIQLAAISDYLAAKSMRQAVAA